MTPSIFPGLKQPDTALYFHLMALIAENGGRLRLAEIIESEIVKEPPRIKEYFIRTAESTWSDSETQLINLGMPVDYIIESTGRTRDAVLAKINREKIKAKLNSW